jgi:hypothetical protein
MRALSEENYPVAKNNSPALKASNMKCPYLDIDPR